MGAAGGAWGLARGVVEGNVAGVGGGVGVVAVVDGVLVVVPAVLLVILIGVSVGKVLLEAESRGPACRLGPIGERRRRLLLEHPAPSGSSCVRVVDVLSPARLLPAADVASPAAHELVVSRLRGRTAATRAEGREVLLALRPLAVGVKLAPDDGVDSYLGPVRRGLDGDLALPVVWVGGRCGGGGGFGRGGG